MQIGQIMQQQSDQSPGSSILQSFSGLGMRSSVMLNIGIVLVTFGGESIFRNFSFNCPCAYPGSVVYGLAFLLAPALVMFMFGMLLNTITWQLVHGCVYRARRSRLDCRHTTFYWCKVTMRALVAPCAWLFIAFLQGSYYECAVAYSFCHNPAVVVGTATPSPKYNYYNIYDINDINTTCICNLQSSVDLELRSHSQLIAWTLITFILLARIAVICFLRCTDTFTYEQNRYVKMYRKIERETFDGRSKDRATAYAQANVTTFYSRNFRSKLDWDRISVVPAYNYPVLVNPKKLSEHCNPSYSPLDQWIKDQNKTVTRWKMAVKKINKKKITETATVKRSESTECLLKAAENAAALAGNISEPIYNPTQDEADTAPIAQIEPTSIFPVIKTNGSRVASANRQHHLLGLHHSLLNKINPIHYNVRNKQS